MAAAITTTVSETDRTFERRGVALPASVVACTCEGCEGRAVLVPTATVEGIGGTARKRDLALHNLVAQSRLLGFPAA